MQTDVNYILFKTLSSFIRRKFPEKVLNNTSNLACFYSKERFDKLSNDVYCTICDVKICNLSEAPFNLLVEHTKLHLKEYNLLVLI
jgi:hypothetical protein